MSVQRRFLPRAGSLIEFAKPAFLVLPFPKE